MSSPSAQTPGKQRPAWLMIVALVAGGLATGAAFAGWANHGVDMFVSMAATGLAWCL